MGELRRKGSSQVRRRVTPFGSISGPFFVSVYVALSREFSKSFPFCLSVCLPFPLYLCVSSTLSVCHPPSRLLTLSFPLSVAPSFSVRPPTPLWSLSRLLPSLSFSLVTPVCPPFCSDSSHPTPESVYCRRKTLSVPETRWKVCGWIFLNRVLPRGLGGPGTHPVRTNLSDSGFRAPVGRSLEGTKLDEPEVGWRDGVETRGGRGVPDG